MKSVGIGKDGGGGLAGWWRRVRRSLSSRWAQAKAPGRFLCDSCRYDYGHACHRPGRPNVTRCPEYKSR